MEELNKDERKKRGEERYREFHEMVLSTPEGKRAYEDARKQLDKWLKADKEKGKPQVPDHLNE